MPQHLNIFKYSFFSKDNTIIFTIFSVWLIFILSYFFLNHLINFGDLNNGFKLGRDSYTYLDETKNLIEGKEIVHKSRIAFYIILFPFVYYKISLFWLVIFQIIFTGLCAFLLYKITSTFFSNKAGFICLILFLFYFPLQIRNFYILTDLIFINTTILLTYFICFFKRKYIFIITFTIIFLSLLKENGILYFVSLLTSLYFYLSYKKKKKLIFIYIIFCFFIIFQLVEIFNYFLSNFNLIENILNRGIIWGYSFESKDVCNINCQPLTLKHDNLTNSNFFLNLLYFFYNNFFNLMKLFIYKVFWLLARIRPYYSDIHNAYIIIYDLILYPSFIYGLICRPKNNFIINTIILYIVFQTILFGMTFVDWSGRFSLYLLPFIMIFSSFGILNFLKLINKKFIKKSNI